MAIDDVVDRATAYGMPGVVVDGMNVIEVYEACAAAVAAARAGAGPSFIEAKTYRFYNHHGVQNLGLKYRSDEEVAEWKERDPIACLETVLAESAQLSSSDANDVWAAERAAIDEAVAFAEASPFPEADDILTDVYTTAEA